MTFSSVLPMFRLGFFRLIGLLFYLFVQYLLLEILTAQDFSAFVAFNSLSMLLGQLSTAGIDGKLVSNLKLSNNFRLTPEILKSIFEFVPFSFLVFVIFVVSVKTSLFGFWVISPSPVEIIFILLVCLFQPLMSTLLVLADKANRPGISDVISVTPWFLRSLILCLFFFGWFSIQISMFSSLDLVYFFYVLSLFLVLCAVFIYCGGRLPLVASAFLGQIFSIFTRPSTFFRLFSTNFVYLSSGFFASAPVLLSPLILRGSSVSPMYVQNFSVAFVIYGVIQSCGSQFLMRQSVARILYFAKDSSLFPSLRYSFSCVRPLFVLYISFIAILSLLSFGPPIFQWSAIDSQVLRLLLLMSFGLFPSAIATLWHALFNLRRFLSLGFASRLLASLLSLPFIVWLINSFGSVGASIGLAVFPFVTLFSFSFVAFVSSGIASNALARKND